MSPHGGPAPRVTRERLRRIIVDIEKLQTAIATEVSMEIAERESARAQKMIEALDCLRMVQVRVGDAIDDLFIQSPPPEPGT